MKKRVYVIIVGSYSANSGGITMLYKLCDILRKSGEEAYVWPAWRPVHRRFTMLRWYLGYFNRLYWASKGWNLVVSPDWDTPVAPIGLIKDAIAIYPEVIAGNPLQSKNVVLWFLNKPGRLTGKIEYGPGELYFFYQKIFNDPKINPNKDNQLMIVSVLSDIYKQVNFEKRSGTCYVLRKGAGRVENVGSLNGAVIDGLPHEEVAKIFNECEYCISYDMHTMYSVYASMCGCKSIVMPEPGVSKSEWQSVKELSYGIAYGKSELPFAMETRDKMIEHYQSIEQNNKDSVRAFVEKCEAFFSTTGHP